MLELFIENKTNSQVDEDSLRVIFKNFNKVLKPVVEEKLGGRAGEVSLILLNDEDIFKINSQYRDKKCPTDVISFAYLEADYPEKFEKKIIAGDIFISIDTANRQAKEKKHSLKKELSILFVHGLLHCFGFEHKTDDQEIEMERWAKRVFGL